MGSIGFRLMDSRQLLLFLEQPLQTCSQETPVDQVVMAGLSYPGSDYWANLAVGWLEQGVPVSEEIQQALRRISQKHHFAQELRHRCLALLRRYS